MTDMRLRILIIGDDFNYLKVDGAMLRSRGLRVYLCDKPDNVSELIGEVKPDIVFFNSKHPDNTSAEIYHALLDNIIYASLPVIYTLMEDDVYLVNRKRTAIKEHRYMISDNIIDAIKMSMMSKAMPAKKHIKLEAPIFNNTYTAYRA